MLEEWRFRRALGKLSNAPNEELREYAQADWPGRSVCLSDTQFLALDFELDGLTARADLLQAGWTPFSGASISLSHTVSIDIRSKGSLDDGGVVVHGIGEARAREGLPLKAFAPKLVAALSGHIVVAHGAAIEAKAIQLAVRNAFGISIPVRAICTLALERKLKPNLVGTDMYRLGACRERYGLPRYKAHDAQTDALAAAELFLAQMSRLPSDATLASVEALYS